jgi:hypothetical protein
MSTFDADAFKKQLNNYGEPKFPVPDGRRKTILGDLNKLFDGNTGRHAFLKWAFGSASSKKLTDAQWWALRCWLGAMQGSDGNWHIRKECYTEAVAWLYWYQREVAGQLELEGTNQ